MKPAVFLDRDGTMIRDMSYLSRVEDVDWYPWTLDAVRSLNRAGQCFCCESGDGSHKTVSPHPWSHPASSKFIPSGRPFASWEILAGR